MAFRNRNDVLVTSGLSIVFIMVVQKQCTNDVSIRSWLMWIMQMIKTNAYETICDVAMVCRRVGSKRVKYLLKTYFMII